MKLHVDRTVPPTDGNHVFVFGSNRAGRHGAGAAEVAARRFGAAYGCSRGPAGASYAIPTKDERLQTLPLHEIAREVALFLDYARWNDAKTFFVTRIGCELAGYTDADIAPMFAQAPDNCSFAQSWAPYLRPAAAERDQPAEDSMAHLTARQHG